MESDSFKGELTTSYLSPQTPRYDPSRPLEKAEDYKQGGQRKAGWVNAISTHSTMIAFGAFNDLFLLKALQD